MVEIIVVILFLTTRGRSFAMLDSSTDPHHGQF